MNSIGPKSILRECAVDWVGRCGSLLVGARPAVRTGCDRGLAARIWGRGCDPVSNTWLKGVEIWIIPFGDFLLFAASI